MVLKEDPNFWISSSDEGLYLMHRILRPDIKSESHMCVGEAVKRSDGNWEVRVAFRLFRIGLMGQSIVGISNSLSHALEVLWEQRISMNWGYYQ